MQKRKRTNPRNALYRPDKRPGLRISRKHNDTTEYPTTQVWEDASAIQHKRLEAAIAKCGFLHISEAVTIIHGSQKESA